MRRIGVAATATVVLVSAALAESPPPPSPAPLPPLLVPLSLPVPPNGCVWAGRAFSEGAEFCFAPRVILKCNAGKWNYDGLDVCTGMTPIDTR